MKFDSDTKKKHKAHVRLYWIKPVNFIMFLILGFACANKRPKGEQAGRQTDKQTLG